MLTVRPVSSAVDDQTGSCCPKPSLRQVACRLDTRRQETHHLVQDLLLANHENHRRDAAMPMTIEGMTNPEGPMTCSPPPMSMV